MAHDQSTSYEIDEESYFVSMTDLLVGMIFIFIILLMSFALNLKQQEDRFDQTTQQLTKADDARQMMLSEIKRAMETLGVKVIIDPKNGVLRLPEELLFLRGEYLITDKGREALLQLSEVMHKILPCYARGLGSAGAPCPKRMGGRLEAIFIEGHTDDTPITGIMGNGISSNWELSARRAIETLKALAPPVVDRTVCQIRDKLLSLACLTNDRDQQLLGVSGYAEFRPVSSARTPIARATNRRIDLRFLMATPNSTDLNAIQHKLETGTVAQ